MKQDLKLNAMFCSIGLYVIPILIILFVVEMIYSYKEDKHLYTSKDTRSNVLVGVGYFISNSISKVLTFFVFELAFRYHLFSFSGSWWIWLLALLGSELSYYCWHRASHEISWFWATHAVHHSSEQFNFSIAFRLPWTINISGYFLFWIWMPLLGFSPFMTMMVLQLGLFYQALLHTETVGKLPAIVEYIFNTPSHHRVHHSSDLKYLDKNHGGVLIIWDRLFQTFQEEEEKPSYGLTSKIATHNPVMIVFHEWIDLFKKAARCGSFKNAINYFIKPPGWSHDGSTKTVKQIRSALESSKPIDSKGIYIMI